MEPSVQKYWKALEGLTAIDSLAGLTKEPKSEQGSGILRRMAGLDAFSWVIPRISAVVGAVPTWSVGFLVSRGTLQLDGTH